MGGKVTHPWDPDTTSVSIILLVSGPAPWVTSSHSSRAGADGPLDSLLRSLTPPALFLTDAPPAIPSGHIRKLDNPQWIYQMPLGPQVKPCSVDL